MTTYEGSKLNATHLERAAVVYVRQSTDFQVHNHVERQRLQYELTTHAKELGFRTVTVIDDDLGTSASGVHRPGFEKLLTAVCRGEVGLVLSLEASRLSRNGRDWHTLLDFCVIVGCLVGDKTTLYDPALPDDRFFLGMKGNFSEMELAVFRQRSMETLAAMAERGELFLNLPAGYESRVRLVLEGSQTLALDGGGALTPRGEIGLRHDAGDAETGAGLEAGLGLRYATGPLTIEGQVRKLFAHEDSDYEEWGASGAIRVSPSASGRGLSVSLASTWGNAGSQAERLWSAPDAKGLVPGEDFDAARQLKAELGYGLAVPGTRGLITPYTALSWTQGGTRAVRTGATWKVTPTAALGLEWTHEPATGKGDAANALLLRSEVGW